MILIKILLGFIAERLRTVKIEFEKEMILGLIELFGEEKAIEELCGVCKTIIEESIKQYNESKEV